VNIVLSCSPAGTFDLLQVHKCVVLGALYVARTLVVVIAGSLKTNWTFGAVFGMVNEKDSIITGHHQPSFAQCLLAANWTNPNKLCATL